MNVPDVVALLGAVLGVLGGAFGIVAGLLEILQAGPSSAAQKYAKVADAWARVDSSTQTSMRGVERLALAQWKSYALRPRSGFLVARHLRLPAVVTGMWLLAAIAVASGQRTVGRDDLTMSPFWAVGIGVVLTVTSVLVRIQWLDRLYVRIGDQEALGLAVAREALADLGAQAVGDHSPPTTSRHCSTGRCLLGRPTRIGLGAAAAAHSSQPCGCSIDRLCDLGGPARRTAATSGKHLLRALDCDMERVRSRCRELRGRLGESECKRRVVAR